MRMVDADAIIMNLDDRYSLRDISREDRDTVVYELNNAPTIELPERKIGEWIKADSHIVICPFCKKASSPKNFCADCGADLRGGNNE